MQGIAQQENCCEAHKQFSAQLKTSIKSLLATFRNVHWCLLHCSLQYLIITFKFVNIFNIYINFREHYSSLISDQTTHNFTQFTVTFFEKSVCLGLEPGCGSIPINLLCLSFSVVEVMGFDDLIASYCNIS